MMTTKEIEDDFTDVEDYSDDVVVDNPNQVEHDQLPSVEEAKMAAGVTGKADGRQKRLLFLVGGLVVLTIILVGLIISAIASPGSGKPVANVTQALHEIALGGESDFVDKDSYQYAAMWKLLPDDMVQTSYSFERLQQRYAMFCLYHSTTPKQWLTDNGWKRMGVDECKWYGVMCDKKGMVTRIGLKGNGLGGEIPREVALIPKLEVFNVNFNSEISGSMPEEICQMEEERKNFDVKIDCSSVQCNCCSNC